MIIDKIEHLEKYVALNPRFRQVVDFLTTHDLSRMEAGSYPIDGADLYVNVDEAAGKTREEAKIEYHQRMIDIQIPLEVTEVFGWMPLDGVPRDDFDGKRDIGFLSDAVPDNYITCQPGWFVAFFPGEGHAPLIADTSKMKKAIFKIKA